MSKVEENEYASAERNPNFLFTWSTFDFGSIVQEANLIFQAL